MRKTRVRQLANGMHIVEARYMFVFWRGVRIVRVATKGAIERGHRDIPMVVSEAPDATHYPLCWHQSWAAAQAELNEIKSMWGASS